MIVCVCNRVSDREIHQAVEQHGVREYDHLVDMTGTGSCCGRCTDCAREVFDAACDAADRTPAHARQVITMVEVAA